MLMMSSSTPVTMCFAEQIEFVDRLFSSWSDCEKVVALYFLMRKLPPVQTKFLAQVLDQFVSGLPPINEEEQANNPVFLNSLCSGSDAASADSLGKIITVLLRCLPLLRTSNAPAKSAYLRLIPAAIHRCNEIGLYRTECQQVMSYALIHPAITAEELTALNPVCGGLPTIQTTNHHSSTSTTAATSSIVGRHQNGVVVVDDSPLAMFQTSEPTAPAANAGSLFSNGSVVGGGLGGYALPPHHHHGQRQQLAGRQSTPAGLGSTSSSLAGSGKTWSLMHGSHPSGEPSGTADSSSSIQFDAGAASVRRVQTGSVPGPDSGGGCGGSPSSTSAASFAAVVGANCSTAVSSTSSSSTHVPLHMSKSAGLVSTHARHGGAAHQPSHPKLARVAAVAPAGSSSSEAPVAAVSDWLRRSVHHQVDAIGTGRWETGRGSDAGTTSSGGGLGMQLLSSSSSSLHMPLSPQSSDASSGSGGGGNGGGGGAAGSAGDAYQLLHGSRGDQEEGGTNPGMQDILVWLKILRLHKYSSLFLQMTYEEMMSLSDDWLDSRGVTKGARNKILLSVRKLHERPSTLRQIEKDVMSSGNVRSAVDQLRQVVHTPIKAYDASGDSLSANSPGYDVDMTASADSGTSMGTLLEGGRRSSESESLSDYDLPGLITRVLGKLCTQLLVTLRPDSDCLTTYLHLLDKCNNHQAFTAEQKKKMLSWRQQIQRVLQFMQRQHRQAASSASLPPTARAPTGAHRALRGQSSVNNATGGPSQPAWTFIGSSAGSARGSSINRHSVVSWQASAPQYPGASSCSGAAQQTSAFCPPRMAQLDPSSAVAKLPLSRTQSAPLRSAKPGVSVISPPVMENDLSSANDDLHASLNSLCISMMEAALEGGLGDAN